MSGLYIHIPFCKSRCLYCGFYSTTRGDTAGRYVDALCGELKLRKCYINEPPHTIYIGGGTPSQLPLPLLRRLFDAIDTSQAEEITMECNPDDITPEFAKAISHLPINRISMGAQTFSDARLRFLCRRHKAADVTCAVTRLRQAGIRNISIDLMYGFQNQTAKDLQNDLDKILKLKPKHISTYCLILEPNTKLYIQNYKPLDGDKESDLYNLITKTLTEHNYIKYELSNFAKPNYESKHNLTYWNNQNYYGFGLGASGYIKNKRYENTRSLTNYLKGNYRLNTHKLSKTETIQNEFILGLRKIKGLNKKDFYKNIEIYLMLSFT